jgi:hypothetical protein
VPDPLVNLVDRVDRLAEAMFTLAAIEVGTREHLTPDQAALRVAEQRHEIRHALACWRPPQGSYRARDLA